MTGSPGPNAAGLLAALLILLLGPAAAAQSGDVDVELDLFGVGELYRPGSFVGVRVLLTARRDGGLGEATRVWVQWQVPNADGDIAEYGRAVALTKGTPRPVWLYAPLPPAADDGSVWPVRVYEFEDARRGRELGGKQIGPPASGLVSIHASMIGVIGGGQLGLNQYRRPSIGSFGVVNTAHEDSWVVSNLRPEDLCDRWEGLRPYEALVWTDALPQDLKTAQADALRAWIQRGGHLVISLREDTNAWGIGEPGRTLLSDLLPADAPQRREEVPVADILPLLTKSSAVSIRDFGVTIQTFDTIEAPWVPLRAIDGDRVVVVQRPFGHGRITLVGLDLSNRQFVSTFEAANGMLVSLPQADAFWNPILGRRTDTPSAGELVEALDDQRLNTASPTEVKVGDGGLFLREISHFGAAGRGLVAALFLFILYWVVAGPGGFALLKHYKRAHHSWLAFAGAAAVFTALAWGSVHLLRENEVRVNHLTVLDHIARPGATGAEWTERDPQLQRAASWLSLYIPGYGDTRVAIASLDDQRDLLVSWTAPGAGAQRFPNPGRYAVDVGDDAADFSLPSRSTATQLYAHWLGGAEGEWSGLLIEDPSDPIRVELDGNREVLRGSILNQLPGPLENVRCIWISSRRATARRYAREGQNELPWVPAIQSGRSVALGSVWAVKEISAGSRFAIPPLQGADFRLSTNFVDEYIKPFEGRASGGPVGTLSLTPDEWRKRIEMLSFFQQLDPPTYLKASGDPNRDTVLVHRSIGREMDLSPWFVRPCLIVIGYLADSSCPIPLEVNGRRVESDGTTVVRWIFPLDVERSIAFPAEAAVAAETAP